MIIGSDFDNTIVSYASLVHDVAVERGLVPRSITRDKKTIRDQVRGLPGGDEEWQKVQAEVYGPRMNEAELIDGALEFFVHCRREGIRIFIVSHKTQFAHFDRTGTDLRQAALEWMRHAGFFDVDGLGLDVGDVFFESTRLKKIRRIEELNCSYFIDDLEEVLAEDSFPSHIGKILFGVSKPSPEVGDVLAARRWKDISSHFFDS